MKKVGIIGGGIIGLALGYKLSNNCSMKVELFEKEDELGMHQSGNNSGVLHCGLYYKPGSLKSKLAVVGLKEMISFCEDNKIEHDLCGKIVVSTNFDESKRLEDLANRGKQNGLVGLKFLSNKELKLREPFVKAEKALLVPQEGIVNYKSVMHKMADLIMKSGGIIHYSSKIVSSKTSNSNNTVIIKTEKDEFEFDLVINCTGLFTDRVYSMMTHQKRPLRIIPFRGEYMNIKNDYKHLVNHLIYPVPDPQYPFLGVHFTKMINGDREVGPNAVLAFKREGYKNSDVLLTDIFDTLGYVGFHNFILKHFKFAAGEFASSLSTTSFVNKAKKMIPDINETMFEKGTAGVRAQAMDANGELIMDFKIEKIGNQIHILNAPSPGATASLAIADYIINNYIN